MDKKIRITEIYKSIQGEAHYVGYPCIFIRTSGCPLNCRWCDTVYSFEGGDELSFNEIMDRVEKLDCNLVELTGGEPMAQESSIALMELLLARGKKVLIETSGSFDIRKIPQAVHIIMDLKCPGSGMVNKNLYDNLLHLKKSDEVKFVVASYDDFLWAATQIKEYQLQERCQVLFFPRIWIGQGSTTRRLAIRVWHQSKISDANPQIHLVSQKERCLMSYLERLKQVESADATAQFSPELILQHALGNYVWDCEDRRYLDLCAGFGALSLGHNHPEMQALLQEYCGKKPKIFHGMGDLYCSDVKVEFLECLMDLMPASYGKAALSLTGAQAVDYALKTAVRYHQNQNKYKFICFEGAYHGLELGPLAITSMKKFKSGLEKLVNQDMAISIPFESTIEQIESILEQNRSELAGMILEPIQGRQGVRAFSIEKLKALKELCQKHEILLIYDEIFVGMGRSGRVTFSEDVPADIMCFGKALAAGLPVSACVATQEIMDRAWPASEGEALHTGTFFGHPFSCAMALKALEIVKRDQLVQSSQNLGNWALAYVRNQLQKRESECQSPGVTFKAYGLMMAFEFDRPGMGFEMMMELKKDGILALVSGEQAQSLTLTPALNIKKEEFRKALDRIIMHLNKI